jgi:hypothetical protein
MSLPAPLNKHVAQEWLTWARAHHHAEGCSCRGCLSARRALCSGVQALTTVDAASAQLGLLASEGRLFGRQRIALA